MVSVTVALVALKARDDHVGTKGANDAYHVAQGNIVTTPFLEAFLGALGEAEVGYASEALVDIVVTVGGEQFESTHHAKDVEEGAADLVLTAFAAIEREQGGVNALASRF